MRLRELVGNNVWIIAEVGINHEGCIETCKKLIKVAAEAGANAVKISPHIYFLLIEFYPA